MTLAALLHPSSTFTSYIINNYYNDNNLCALDRVDKIGAASCLTA